MIALVHALSVEAMTAGTLAPKRRHGYWSPTPALSPSRRLAEELEQELVVLTDDQWRLLETVAFGEPLGRAEMEAVTTPEVTRSLEEIGLVSPGYHGRRFELRLANPNHRNALRARIPSTRARRIAGQLARSIEATGAHRHGDALRIATWRLVSGGGAWETLLDGAIAAFKRYDYPLAERLARASYEAQANFHAALLAARLASLQGRTEASEDELTVLAADAEDDTQRGLVALARIDNLVTWTGRDRHGILAQAEDTITDLRWRAALEARRHGLLLYSRGPRAAAQATGPFLERSTEPGAIAFACVIAAYSLGRLGQIDAAIDAAQRGLAAQVSRSALVGDGGWWHVAMHCLALNYAGRLDEANTLASEHYREALIERATEAQALLAVVTVSAVGERGRVQTAIRNVREALALSEQLGRPLITRFGHIYGALALALGGRAHEAAEALTALDALDLPDLHHDQVDLIQARAWTAAATGQLPQARQLLRQAADVGEDIGDLVGATTALHGLVRLGAVDALDRLEVMAHRVEGALAPARVDHAHALADNDAPGLEKVSRAFEATGADLLAAEAAADASVVHRRRREQRQADAAQRRAEALAQRGEGLRTPALQAIGVRGCLTPAQWETALMAAAGLPSKEIAEGLCVSRRTVENRLQQSYEQLGISSRAALARCLGRQS
jgi:DNA-binding CsgD family transcriptional regulator